MDQTTTGKFITKKRKELNLTQEQLSQKLGVSNKTISKWETDETLPDIRQSKHLAVLYGLSLDELIEFDLKDDELKIDGNMAIAWSDSLKFTVERSSKSLVGSAVSGEGLVNVYRGTGRVLMAPTQ